MVYGVDWESPSDWVITGDRKRAVDQALAGIAEGAIPIAAFITHGFEPEADRFDVGIPAATNHVPTADQGGQVAIIRRQLIWTWGGGGVSDRFGKFLAALLMEVDPARADRDDGVEGIRFRMSMLHRLASRDDHHGGHPIGIVFGFRRIEPARLDRECALAQ